MVYRRVVLSCLSIAYRLSERMADKQPLLVNQPGINGVTALHLTSERGDYLLTELLLNKGADVTIMQVLDNCPINDIMVHASTFTYRTKMFDQFLAYNNYVYVCKKQLFLMFRMVGVLHSRCTQYSLYVCISNTDTIISVAYRGKTKNFIRLLLKR